MMLGKYLPSFFIPYIRISSEWITDLNVKTKTISSFQKLHLAGLRMELSG
jgi:hypothetical protein